MPSLGRIGRQLTSLLWRASIAEEVDAELDFHVEALTRELMEAGMSREAARDEALRRFGDIRRVSEHCRKIGENRERDVRRTEYLSDLRHDVTVALRQLARSRAFAAVAILTLALGVGATSSIFSITDAVVLRALPFADPDRVVELTQLVRGNSSGATAADYADWHEQMRGTFSHLAAAISQTGFTDTPASAGDTPELLGGGRVSAEYFAVFGVAPAIGRTFLPEEDVPGAADVVVLSDRLWKRRFAADPHIVGRELHLNGERYRVIGVMPPAFDVTTDGDELWVPLALTPEQRAERRGHFLRVVGRLEPGVTREQAHRALDAESAELAKRFPDTNTNSTIVMRGFADGLVGGYRTRLLILLGAVGLVLLIACANVANLLLARGAARAKEFAIRVALGAGRARIVRQLLTESAVLAVISAAVGLVLAHWLVRGIIALSPENVPRLERAGIDGRVLAFTLAIVIGSSLAFGLVPALRAGRRNVQGTLREGGRGSAIGAGSDGLRALLVSAEVALAIMLLAGAGLLIRSAILLQGVAPGFDPHGVVTARAMLPVPQYADRARVTDTYGRIREEVAHVPGVTSAALSSVVPLSNSQMHAGIVAEGQPLDADHAVLADFRIVSPAYFATMRIPLRRGRDFTDRDDSGSPDVVIVNDALARRLWPGQDAIGRRIALGRTASARSMLEVVGIVGDLREEGLDQPAAPEFYVPVRQLPAELWNATQRSLVIVARTSGDPLKLDRPLRRAVMRVDAALPIADVQTMDQLLAGSLATTRFNTLLLATLGVMALVLASGGIYGVIAYFVTQRTQEIGIRMALGATPRNVLALVVKRGLRPVALGAIVGLGGAAAATHVLESQLFGVSATDPVTFAAVVALLLGIACLACYLPARRATRVDPVSAINAGGA